MGDPRVLHVLTPPFPTRRSSVPSPALPSRPVEGLSFPGRRNPLEVRAGTDRRRHARKRRLPVPRRPCRSSEGTDRDEGMRDGGVLRRSSGRSEEHTSELQSLMRISYAVFCLKKTKTNKPS